MWALGTSVLSEEALDLLVMARGVWCMVYGVWCMVYYVVYYSRERTRPEARTRPCLLLATSTSTTTTTIREKLFSFAHLTSFLGCLFLNF
jgi:hypothetical protein